MADERSNETTYKLNPDFRNYDLAYYNALMPYIKGEVLDVGCGAGMFIREYSKKDEVISVIGIDKYIDEMPKDDPKVIAMQFKLPEEFGVSKDSAKFDTVVSTEFIEHIERKDLEPMLEKIKGVLKPDGLFVGSTPNKITETTNPYHLYEYTLTELVGILKKYFSEVEAFDNGRNCTCWIAKI